ncbi:MAG: hypothetical protein ABSH20_19890 [Tepidisphaeraceae bacterium]|jgi:hypothetical protein
MRNRKTVLDDGFLESRCMILELAAVFDRYDRALPAQDGAVAADPRLALLHQALAIMADPAPGSTRVQRILTLLSDPVD